jgi:hypothetical protein
MKVNTIREFHNFLNELGLERGYIREFLYNIFTYNYYKDRYIYILDLEKRKVVQTSQTFSLDSEWISHIEETVFYELYLEFYSNYKVFNKRNNEDTTVLTFKTLEDLQKVEQFIKDNFKFLNKGEIKK